MENTDIEKNTKNPQHHQQNAASKAPWFVSEYDRRRFSRYTPWFVYSIMISDIAIFIVVMIINNCPKNYFAVDACFARFLGPFSFQPFRENPLLGPSSTTLLKMGALQWDKVVHQHQGWRLISCIWLHAGVIHLGFNMGTLSIVGLHLEQRFGFVRIGILYLVSGFGGSVLSSLFLRQNISVGASGPLFGLLGATLVELFTNWSIYPEKVASLFLIMFLIAINLAIGILPHVGNFAHIGGFLTGLLLGFIVLRCPRFELVERFPLPGNAPVKTKYQSYEMVFYYITLGALVVGFVVALVMLFKGKNGNDSCNWCHYLNCVPTSNWQCGS